MNILRWLGIGTSKVEEVKKTLPAPQFMHGEEEDKSDAPSACFANRELSWLKFNTRVLEEAEDPGNPFCERLSFASIFQSNLDEFFMVRVGSLYDQMLLSPSIRENKTHMTCEEQIKVICKRCETLAQRKDKLMKELSEELPSHGIRICHYKDLDEDEKRFLAAYFTNDVLPLLTPQIIGKKQPFPFLRSKHIYAVLLLQRKSSLKLGIIECTSDILPRMVAMPGSHGRFMLMEEIILHFVPKIYDKWKVKSRTLLRMIRNADIDPDEDLYDESQGDFRAIMEQLVKNRKKLSPIRLTCSAQTDEAILTYMKKYLGLKRMQIFRSLSPLDLSYLGTIRDLLRDKKNLFYPPYTPKIPADFDQTASILSQIRERDRFLFYPYDSMRPFLSMLNEAAIDPDVVSLKITLYRVTKNSLVIEPLIRASESGKDVTVLVELRARFDEENNIEWSRRLEEAGCRVLYGLDHLKVHSKLCLITRHNKDGIFYYTQVGTGNYNEKTATLYTDFALMTADQEIGREASEVFQKLCLGQTVKDMHHLMVAPHCMRTYILDKLDHQIVLAKEGRPAYFGGKMNSLTDKKIINRLIQASRAGVKIALLVRAACCLVSGIQGWTDNITISSIVGRYLEHSRIYIFGAADAEQEIYISSADLMTRNMVRRVEVGIPLYDEDIRKRVQGIFRTLLSDNVKRRIQKSDGTYVYVPHEHPAINAQEIFQRH